METNYLDLIIDLIINNTNLSYGDKEKLRISDDTSILEVIKVIAKDRYDKRVIELNEENKEDF
jgi:hypothetical protein